jgi:hypothetical protein
VVVVEQRGGLRVDAQDDVAPVAAVAAVRSAQRLELLTVDGDTAVAAGTAGYVQYYPVYKASHVDLLICCPTAFVAVDSVVAKTSAPKAP